MPSYDTGRYRHNAHFSLEVYPGVFWLPLNALGRTRYTNEQIATIIPLSPEEKREKISNVYEAVQLFQAGNFTGILDNVNHFYDNGQTLWQTHTPGREAVVRNHGCCAADTHWLSYLLQGRYDAMHSLWFGHEDGNGHIISCIEHHHAYYFLDMMMCRNDSQRYLCVEDGRIDSWRRSLWNGFLYRCTNPVDFCHFQREHYRNTNRSVPYVFCLRGETCLATGMTQLDDTLHFLLPREEHPRLLFCSGAMEDRLLIRPLPEDLRDASLSAGA